MFIIRRAHRRDAKALAAIAEATFRDTFASANTAQDMDRHCGAAFGERIQSEEIASEKMVTLLCERRGDLVGFAQLRWGRAPDCVVAHAAGELQRLYVANDFHGQGAAQDLMKACLQEAAARGSDVVWLGVWERNPKAIAFYKKFGFVEIGAHVFPLGADRQRDIVMARPVAS